jgi:general L-amino acid transport system substrate-binding protein
VKRAAGKILLLIMLACCGGAMARAGTLDRVKARGELACGVNPNFAGFASLDPDGHWTGFDVDYCRAIAAAIFNDPSKVRFTALQPPDDFAALRAGAVDVLADNATWTLSHDTSRGLMLTIVTFFDGQGFMVHQKLNISSVLELSGATICVAQDTTNELNLADFFQARQMQFHAVRLASEDAAAKAYAEGRCDALTNEATALYARRVRLEHPDASVLLPEIISKEPLGLVVRQGDDQWFNLVRWVHFAMVDAEESGISSQNVDDKMASDDPDTRRLLGVEGNFGEGLGLSKDWAYRIIKLTGNYGEVFDRDLGNNSPLQIKRGLNQLWSKGGLQYAPPVR